MSSFRVLSALLGILLAFNLHASENDFAPYTDNFNLTNTLNAKVLETIDHSENVPGLKSEEFSALKTEILNTWGVLFREGVVTTTGTDKDIRPIFVALQAVVEHVLASQLQNNIKTLQGFIHTPMPATPLCTKGEISKELVDPSIETDPHRLFTVKARTTIIRDYLFKGGDLYIVYPKGGFYKRSEEQQKIYKEELGNYPSHLFDTPLNCESIPTDLIGATFLFQDHLNNTFVFAIKMTQAKNPQDIGDFGLWFGPLNNPSIQKRMDTLSSFIQQNKYQ